MTDGKRNIIHQLLDEHEIHSAEDIQDMLKDLLSGTIKEMMENQSILTAVIIEMDINKNIFQILTECFISDKDLYLQNFLYILT